MTRGPLPAVIAAIVVLVGLVAAEWIAAEVKLASLDRPETRVAQTQDRPVTEADVTAAPAAIDGWLRVALARPLMSSSRQASARTGASTSLNGGLPRLSGTMVASDGRVAIFARDDAGHAVIAHEGGLLGPYKISRITPNSVTLDGPTGEQTLHPSFGTRQNGDAADPDAAVPPFAMPQMAAPGQPFRMQMPPQPPSGQ